MVIKNKYIVERKIHDTFFLIDIRQNYLENQCYLYEINEIGDFIWKQGRMCPCMKLRHKGVELQKDNYDEIWKAFGVFSKLKASNSYVCNKCEAQYYCDICPAEMDFLYGDMEYRPVSLCKSAKIRKGFYEGKMTFEEAVRAASFDE